MTAAGFAVANKQCPICRSTDVDQKYVTTEPYYQCNQCGERFKKLLRPNRSFLNLSALIVGQ
jgi:transposase-like protein